jgi:hypothetical protein
MAPTRDAVEELNQRAQRRLLDAGQLDPDCPGRPCGPYVLHEGDEIVTRRNDRSLRTDQDHMVRNRDHWTITTIYADGGVAASGVTGSVRLPAEFVTNDVELGYAQTSHANQGRTVDDAILYLDGRTDTRGIYVPLTRGRHTNQAYVALTGEETPADVLAASLARTWIDRPALEVQTQLHDPTRPPRGQDASSRGGEQAIRVDKQPRRIEQTDEPAIAATLTERRDGLIQQLLEARCSAVATPDVFDIAFDLKEGIDLRTKVHDDYPTLECARPSIEDDVPSIEL